MSVTVTIAELSAGYVRVAWPLEGGGQTSAWFARDTMRPAVPIDAMIVGSTFEADVFPPVADAPINPPGTQPAAPGDGPPPDVTPAMPPAAPPAEGG